MKYELDRLGSDNFENLVQALIFAEFGIDAKIYGDGPDGQREAVIDNSSKSLVYRGDLSKYWHTVVQAKFKSPDGKEDEWSWLRRNLKSELDGFREKKTSHPEMVPETFLFYSNIILTSTLDTGIHDKADNFAKTYYDIIPQIIIYGADDIRALLDNHRDVATRYTSFIMPGDVLAEMYHFIKTASNRPFEVLIEYAKSMVSDDSAVRLEQAGSVSDKTINIRNVYTDLEAVPHNGSNNLIDGIARYIIQLGNNQHKKVSVSPMPREGYMYYYAPKENIVLIGNAGQGKSTLCQYICQIYRAALLKRFSHNFNTTDDYLNDPDVPAPLCERYPFRITLKEYASWVSKRNDDEGRGVVQYILFKITRKTGMALEMPDFRRLLSGYSWIFMFDGLDEVPASSNRSVILSEIQNFLNYDLTAENCDCMVICTSRPQGYDNAFSPKLYNHYELSEMSKPLCTKYLIRLLEHIEENGEEREKYFRILCNALDDPMVSKLMTTPLYASIVAILVKSGGTPPTRRYELFREYCDVAERRERQKGTLPSFNDGYDWIKAVHREIGFTLQMESENQDNAAAEMTDDRCIGIIIKYLNEAEYSDSDEYMKTNVSVESKARELYSALVNRLPFVSEIQGEKGAIIVFPLRSIQEYFSAEKLINTDFDDLAVILDKIALNTYWRNVYLFVAGYFANNPHFKNINDQLYWICIRKNADGDEDPENADACRIALPGSYLALDMLCDNIFNTSSVKNKYLKIVDKLLEKKTSSYFTDRFLKLPNSVIDNYINGKLESYINANNNSDCAALEILVNLAQKNKAAAKVMIKLMQKLKIKDYWLFRSIMRIDVGVIDICDIDTFYNYSHQHLTKFIHVFGYDSTYFEHFIQYEKQVSNETAKRILRQMIVVIISPYNYYLVQTKSPFVPVINDELYKALCFVREQIRKTVYFSANSITYCDIFPNRTLTDSEDYQLVYNYLCSNDMEDIAALIKFIAEPDYSSFQSFIVQYCNLEKGDRELLWPVLRNNWLFCEDDGLLTQEDSVERILSRYSPEYYKQCVKTHERIAELAAAEDYERITMEGYWGNRVWLRSSDQVNSEEVLTRIVNALKSKAKVTIDNSIVITMLDLLDECSVIPPEFVDFCISQNKRISDCELSNNLYMFLLSVYEGILPGDFVFSKGLEVCYFDPDKCEAIIKKVSDAITKHVIVGNGFHSICALIPIMFDISNKATELIPVINYESYIKARQSKHFAATFGCLIAALRQSIPAEYQEIIKEDVKRFLLDDSCLRCFSRCSEAFCLDAKLLIYETVKESRIERRIDIMNNYEQAINYHLASLPSGVKDLI